MEAHGQAVIDAFKKFDKDGNGVIDRKELGAVLKSLDGDPWLDNVKWGQVMTWYRKHPKTIENNKPKSLGPFCSGLSLAFNKSD